MRDFHRLALFLAAAGLLGATPGRARNIQFWSYQDLTTKSDVVAIVEPIANKPVSDKKEPDIAYGQAINTTFKVLCCLKGASPGGTIVVRHFIYKDMVPNAGELVNFLIGPLKLKATYERNGKVSPWDLGDVTPQWLLFLSKTADGTFIPVSGQWDPNFSFRELHPASAYGTINLEDQ